MKNNIKKMSYIGVWLLANNKTDEFLKYKRDRILDESWVDLFKSGISKTSALKLLKQNAQNLYLTKLPETTMDFNKNVYNRIDNHTGSSIMSSIITYGLEYLLKIPDDIVAKRYAELRQKSIKDDILTKNELHEYQNLSKYLTLLSYNKDQFKRNHPKLFKAYEFILNHGTKWTPAIEDAFKLALIA